MSDVHMWWACLDSLDGGGKVLASESLTESEGYFTDQGSSDEATEAQADAGAEEDEVLVLRLPSAAQLQSDLSDSDQSISSSASEPVSSSSDTVTRDFGRLFRCVSLPAPAP